MKRSSLTIALLVMVLVVLSLSRWSVPQVDDPVGGSDITAPSTGN